MWSAARKGMRYANKSKFMTRRRKRFAKHYPNINNAIKPVYGFKGLRSTVNFMKGMINAEIKRFDTTASVTPTATPGIVLLSDIAAGDDVGNRDGNSILAKYNTGTVQMSIAAASTLVEGRVLFFIDTQNNGSAPAAADILEAPTNVLSPLNRDNTQRFTILNDIHITLSNTGDKISTQKYYKKLGFHMRYTGTSTGTNNKNSLYVLYMSTDNTNPPTINIYNRLAYYDN